MADEGSAKSNIALIVAIVTGALALLSNALVSYLNNQGTLEVERQRFKTSLILEAVKVGDKQKALDNLNFFIDAGFLDDPGGSIKALLNKNLSPLLPVPREAYSYDTYTPDSPFSFGKRLSDPKGFDDPAIRKWLSDVDGTIVSLYSREGDSLASKGDAEGAYQNYLKALTQVEARDCDSAAGKELRGKIERLPGNHSVRPCLTPLTSK